ncbi:protein kinase (macronuclear) [Tetrahymena thermophila SB210]|uniref:Protein kinase n=1 Tax=Tetrahymena thermophila (strain SB210) TaxID=312017 RepID=I7M1J1_TETTS|nr:protein kinase [Tetrahymena thermophila SB210]EAR96442.2 protein kinase [Tetrahymena thermophila SB210]|eukprot:XP_001016687.2 protein kinase [Tetrahymena thermophila SB210]
MQNQENQIKIIKSIGKGSYGEVFLCEDQLGHKIALKAIKRNLLDDKFINSYKTELNALKKLQSAQNKSTLNDICYQADIENANLVGLLSKRSMSFDQEMCFLKEQNSSVNCQDHQVNAKSNIIQFVKSIDNYPFQFNNKTYSCHALFIEYAKNGCLGSYLESPKLTFLPINILRRIAKQLFQGIQEMHSAHLVHRDIKEDNIVFGEGYTLKLIDLSFAGRNDDEVCGTQKYISPEILKKEVQMLNCSSSQSNSVQQEQKVQQKELKFQRFAKIDTFAAGVVLFRLATKIYPFGSASQFDYKYKYIVSKQYDQFWSNVKFIVSSVNENNPDTQFNHFLQNRIQEETLQDLDTSSNSYDSNSEAEDNQEENENQSSSSQSNQENQTESQSSYNRKKSNITNRSSKKLLSYIKSKRAVSQVNFFLTPNEQAFFQQLMSEQDLNSIALSNQEINESYQQNIKEQIEQLKDLIQNLLSYEIDSRYGIQEALNHPFFTQFPNSYASTKDLEQFFSVFNS